MKFLEYDDENIYFQAEICGGKHTTNTLVMKFDIYEESWVLD